MNNRMSKMPTFPVKNQEMSISIKGRTFTVCSAEQIEFMVQTAKDRFKAEAYDKREKLSEEDLQKKLKEYRENCGYATLDWILGQMTPAERKDWADKYRFEPITRTIK